MRLSYSISLLLFATALQAGTPGAELLVQTYSDYVVFDNFDNAADLQVTIAGPEGFRYTGRHSGAEPAVVDLIDQSGQGLADGLYKYEVYAVPKVTIPRNVSSAMPDRNDVREQTGPAPSRQSGSFRVQDGAIIDGQEVEIGEEAQ